MSRSIHSILLTLLLLYPLLTISTQADTEHRESWIDAGQPANTAAITALCAFHDCLFAATEFAHLYFYDTDRTWTYAGQAGDTATTTRVLHEYDSHLYAGNNGGTIYRYDGGTTWTYVGNPQGSHVFCMATYQDRLYVGTYTGYVYRYDGDTTWTYVGNPGESELELWVNTLIVHQGCLYAGKGVGDVPEGGRVYRYEEDTTWTYVGEPAGPHSWDIVSLGSCDDTMYATNRDGNISSYQGGTSWNVIGQLDGYFLWSSAVYYHTYFVASTQLCCFNGTEWSNLGSPIKENGAMIALAVYHDQIYVSGNLDFNGHVYYYQLEKPQEPHLQMAIVPNLQNHSIGIQLQNTGTLAATHLTWTVEITGGIYIQHRQLQGEIPQLDINEQITIPLPIRGLGLGRLTALPCFSIQVHCDEGATSDSERQGAIIGPFVFLL